LASPTASGAEGSTRVPRDSLRSELLLNLAFLAAAALLLGLWMEGLLQALLPAGPRATALLVALVLLDVLVFVAFGRYLVNRLVLRPLSGMVEAAEGIARGEYERRVPLAPTAEMATLALSLNRLTDQLLTNQRRLAENVRSLDETNRLLNETQRELVQAEKMASLGRLSAGVAHEIGNPLGAMIGYLSVLQRREVEPEVVQGAEREARRIDAIVRGLLEYARPAPAAREPVDVNESVLRVVELLRRQGRLATVELTLDLDESAPRVEGAPHRVDQIFVNLLMNAEAAMGGEGRITVVTHRERFTPARSVPARRADDPPGVDYSHLRRLRYGSYRDPSRLVSETEVVRIVVADTGPGIPPEHIDSVLDPFFTTKAPGEGTGLGLAIVASTVAELGGRIEVSSAPAAGATFHLYIPVAGEEIREG
jgi:signal transduction histidine kinase